HDTCPKLRRQKRVEADIGAEVVEDATRLGEAPDCRLLARLIDPEPTAVGMGPDDPAAPSQRAGHDRYSDPSGYQRQGRPDEPSGQGFASQSGKSAEHAAHPRGAWVNVEPRSPS